MCLLNEWMAGGGTNGRSAKEAVAQSLSALLGSTSSKQIKLYSFPAAMSLNGAWASK